MKLLIKGGRIIDPSQEMDKVANLFIEDGRVKSIGDACRRRRRGSLRRDGDDSRSRFH